MNNKDAFLNRIADQINSLKEFYEFNKQLPDEHFGMIKMQIKQVDLPTANVIPAAAFEKKITTSEISKVVQNITGSDYGQNKKLVLEILNEEQKALVKWTITKRFADKTGKQFADVVNTVTNTLSSLNMDRTIRGYKPNGLKFKGFFWALNEWFDDDDTIKPEHSPFTVVPKVQQ